MKLFIALLFMLIAWAILTQVLGVPSMVVLVVLGFSGLLGYKIL